MKKNFSLSIFIASFSFLLTGCYTASHVYSTVSTPELTHAKEKKMDLYPGADHVEGQFASSPKEHLGFILNSYVSYSRQTKGTLMGDLGFGYYGALNEQSKKEGKWFFDIYGGFGGGTRKYAGLSQPGDITGRGDIIGISSEYTNTFVQSSLYCKNNRALVSFTLHGGWYYFTYFNSHYTYSHGSTYHGLISKFEDQSMYDISCAMTLKYQLLKKRNLYFIAQFAGRISYLDKMWVSDTHYSSFNTRPFTLNCGILIPFNKGNN